MFLNKKLIKVEHDSPKKQQKKNVWHETPIVNILIMAKKCFNYSFFDFHRTQCKWKFLGEM